MENSDYLLLLVDDEEDITEFLSYNLKKEGYRVQIAYNGKKAIALAKQHTPHLILLDIMMPEMDGIETCEALRHIPELQNTLIAFLTARGEDYSQIAGFEAGADDYITKPIKPKVLISRIKALLKRLTPLDINTVTPSSDTNSNLITQKDIVIDRERFLVTAKGVEIFLPRKEFNLLALLVSKPNKVFTREEIYNTVWGEDVVVGDRTIDVHIRKLREKIGSEYIYTIKGVGYKFIEEE